jgi:hypothetical protein
VAVHAEDEEEAATAEKVLSGKNPQEIQRYDSRGRRFGSA